MQAVDGNVYDHLKDYLMVFSRTELEICQSVQSTFQFLLETSSRVSFATSKNLIYLFFCLILKAVQKWVKKKSRREVQGSGQMPRVRCWHKHLEVLQLGRELFRESSTYGHSLSDRSKLTTVLK